MSTLSRTMQIKIVSDQQEKIDAFLVRHEVFVMEQQVPPDLEKDAYDDHPDTVHLVAYIGNKPVAAARFRTLPSSPESDHKIIAKVERVAVLKSYRGNGNGQKLMYYLEQEAIKRGVQVLKLNAQLHASPFYAQLGYESYGDLFMDAGIKHVAMKKELPS